MIVDRAKERGSEVDTTNIRKMKYPRLKIPDVRKKR